MKRRLIVCCDGTWQDLGQSYPTNVVKIAQAIKPVDENHIHQIVYYDEGIGAKQINTKETNLGDSLMQRIGGFLDKCIQIAGGAFGLGIDHKILDAYRFLCVNYEPGDDIYLFGFSRGAYTVRSLAGLIYNSGLLKRENIREIPKAYKIYRDRRDENKKPIGTEAKAFREDYAHGNPENYHVPIKALCCWDTVASLGIPDLIPFLNWDKRINEKYSFHDCRVNPSIENAFHGVAIDETRKVFDVTLMEPANDKQKVNQVWFPGNHGSVGGGCEERGLSDGALEWMIQQVTATSLELALDRNCVTHPVKNSSEVVQGVSPNPIAPFDDTSQSLFNICGTHRREIKGGFDDLHESVIQRYQATEVQPRYRPKNPTEWSKKKFHELIADKIKAKKDREHKKLSMV
ncbi:MAG: DUF2235 domain-containing protein [Microcystaceae cyanobacterium]